jgi:uncharacterized protein (TIGR01244 family)
MKALDGTVLIAGQIRPEDVAGLKVAMIVNNRPDREEPGQPPAAVIEAAAKAAGIDCRNIPVAGTISAEQVEAMAQALEQAEGKVLAFCRSGTRSAWLWALARASRGADPETLIAKAAAAGYDLSPLRPHLRRG